MRRPWRIAAIALFALALAAGGLLGDRLLALTDQTRDTLRLYTDLVKVAHDKYGAEVSYRDLVYASIQGMIRTLDPHTTFLVAEEYQGMREKQQTSYYGLGILVGVRNGQLTVIALSFLAVAQIWRANLARQDCRRLPKTFLSEHRRSCSLDQTLPLSTRAARMKSGNCSSAG